MYIVCLDLFSFLLSLLFTRGCKSNKVKVYSLCFERKGTTEITARTGSIGIVGVPSGARRFGMLETCERRKCEEGRIC